MNYTMKEVSSMLHIPSTTIRYYEKEGLLPNVRRKESGYRVFSDNDVSMLKMIECLKKTNMPIKDIRTFAGWVQEGDSSLKERYEMFLERRRMVHEQMKELEETLKVIDYKCWYYETALEAGTEKIHMQEEKSVG